MSLQTKIDRLCKFEELLREDTDNADNEYMMREALMVVEAIGAERPDTLEVLRNRLPRLYQLAGINQN